MIRLIPGDAVAIMLGANTEITDEAMNELRSRLGLDKSILEQYFFWVSNKKENKLSYVASQGKFQREWYETFLIVVV